MGKKKLYYTARHLLEALQNLDDDLLDMPLILVRGKDLTKPNLVHGFIPCPTPLDFALVEEKKPSLLSIAQTARRKK
jgi:hypothetical protein